MNSSVDGLKYFSSDFEAISDGVSFTNPFRYVPDRAVREAAKCLIEEIDGSEELSSAFGEGKMLGVLIVRDTEGRTGYLSGFSGNAGGKSIIPGFVPPICDLSDPEGYYKRKEREISEVVMALRYVESSDELKSIRDNADRTKSDMEDAVAEMKSEIAASRLRRDKIRETEKDANVLAGLIRQSQSEKSTLRRLKKEYEVRLEELHEREKTITSKISSLKTLHRQMSDELQKWIFGQYIVHNMCGKEASIWRIFNDAGLVPPGGTGECAAPKLLEYAFRNNLTPLSMGEFWYGESPETAVRTHGRFYPSCTSKCGPLLTFMLKGLTLKEAFIESCPDAESVKILYSDDYMTVVSKPSGMPSVPGLDGKKSLQEYLTAIFGKEVFAVHRLDMDTSGVMVFAFDTKSQESLQRQFENRTVSKLYRALLCPAGRLSFEAGGCLGNSSVLVQGNAPELCCKGTISLPLSPDYDERPRQKVDAKGGKEAVTEYEIVKEYHNGISEVIFHPLTGRTHQLRVHSAHILGLGRPIAGDLLYGGFTDGISRLCLHAESLSFDHPATGKHLDFTTPTDFSTSDCVLRSK